MRLPAVSLLRPVGTLHATVQSVSPGALKITISSHNTCAIKNEPICSREHAYSGAPDVLKYIVQVGTTTWGTRQYKSNI